MNKEHSPVETVCGIYVAAHPDAFIEMRAFDARPVFQVEGEFTQLPDKGKGKTPPIPLKASVISPLPGLVGILYFDRVRYRHAGVVLGEHITTIPVSPGEEVNLYQKSETRLKTSYEKTVDAESEAEFAFSSVWSTEIGLDTQDTFSANFGANLGANIGAAIKVFNIGGSAGGDGSIGFESSISRQVRNAHDLTYEINRRLRIAHKTVVSTSSDRGLQTGTSRRLINDNPDLTVNYRV